mmetsp:Transcript_20303/g.36246  ORF Transcript_20303/g.36246 Transcript_20303/m.36246 type:complete len:235 (-) Transcript_20303:270-974(-)
MCSLKPAAFSGQLKKQSSSLLSVFRTRFFLLKDGYLYWNHIHRGGCHDDENPEWTGWINLSLTPCEVGPVPGKDGRILLRPTDGHRWSELDPHSAANTTRPVILEASKSEHSVDEWLVQIAKHIAHSKTLPAPSLSTAVERLEFPADEKFTEPCPVCFEDIENKEGIRAGCGHKFHKACLVDWLEAQMRAPQKPKKRIPQGSCPICREVLVDTQQAETPGKPSPVRPWHLCTRC